MPTIRFAEASDGPALTRLRTALWPEGAAKDHEKDLEAIFAGAWSETYPYVVLVAEAEDGTVVGFAEVTLRSRADGCDPSRPVGYLEGWFVDEPYRGRGIGGELLRAAETWARAQGCAEMASDTWIDSSGSQRAHEALGFEVVNRCVNYKKAL